MGKYHSKRPMLFNLAFLMKCKYMYLWPALSPGIYMLLKMCVKCVIETEKLH